MARVVVSGVSSYTGACIAAALSEQGHEVVGLCHRASTDYAGLPERRLGMARARGVTLVFGLAAQRFPAWLRTESVDAWIHHHHPMENFRSEAYDVARAEQEVLGSLTDLVATLTQRGARLVIYSSTYFEAGEGGQAPSARVTPYAALKARVYGELAAECAKTELTLSRVVIPAPTGALENADRLTPLLLRAAEAGRSFLLRSPDSVMDLLPGETLAQSYVELVRRGLDGASGETRRPSGLVTSAADWARRVDLRIAQRLGWQLELNIPAQSEAAVPVHFENPCGERVRVDWDEFFERYAHQWQGEGA